MTVAFYAPLKSPDHPTPSGDRNMARAIMAALRVGGYAVDLASDLRSLEREGDAAAQDRIMAAAEAEVERLLSDHQGRVWTAWLTYHNYYKAPDLIGPRVAATLGVPYVLVEASRARKRLSGPWARFAAAAEAATDAAATVFYVTAHDALTLRRDATQGQTLRHLKPFLARETLPKQSDLTGPILTVGMMRQGDKLQSYALIAESLQQLPTKLDWALHVAGDGPAAPEVRGLMAPFGDRVTFLGALTSEELAERYARAGLFFWPGVNEAFGMSYLEAQAAGLPVVAQDRPGVRDVVFGPKSPVERGADALAARIEALLRTPGARLREGRSARERIASDHLLGPAAATLKTALELHG